MSISTVEALMQSRCTGDTGFGEGELDIAYCDIQLEAPKWHLQSLMLLGIILRIKLHYNFNFMV